MRILIGQQTFGLIASGAIPVSNEKRRNAHAQRYYEEIRKRTTDIQAIAKNTGWEERIIERIKNHVFFREHDLGYDEPVRFDPEIKRTEEKA